MKTMKKALALMLAFVLVMGTAVVGFDGILALKASAAETVNSADGKLHVRSDGSFTILQVTDLHDSVGFDDGKVASIRTAIKNSNPDLIVVTGDNITGNNSRSISGNTGTDTTEKKQNMYRLAIKQFVDLFYNEDGEKIPFAVTFGNHDLEAASQNGYGNLSDVYGLFLDQGAIDYDNHAIDDIGTGCIPVYNAAGTEIVNKVLLINSGSWVDKSKGNAKDDEFYGRAGDDEDNKTNETRYQQIVEYVGHEIDSDTNVKVIAFQHIPLQEIYLASGILEKGGSISAKATGNTDISTYHDETNSSGKLKHIGDTKYQAASSKLGGSYKETACCSYESTKDLYLALAKSNTLGIFYGHDHKNTIYGKGTCYGKELVQGYGGGLEDGQYFTTTYTISSGGSLTKTASNTRSYTYQTPYAETYISEIGVFAGNTANEMHNACTGYASGYKYVEYFYNTSTSADLNAGAGGKYICIGYNTTTNPNEAIRDIRATEMVKTVASTSYNNCTYYLAKSAGGTGDCNEGSTHYTSNHTDDDNTNIPVYLYYTKDAKAGTPITEIAVFNSIANARKAVEDEAYSMVCNFRENHDSGSRGVAEFADGTSGTYRYIANLNAYSNTNDKKNQANRLFLGYKSAKIGTQKLIPCAAPVATGTTYADDSAPTIVVPDTIYVNPTDKKTFQHYLNNTTAGAAVTGAAGTGSVYFSCSNVTGDVSVSLKDGTTAQNLSISKVNNGSATSFTGSLSTALAASTGAGTGTKQLEWEFTYTYKGETRHAYAYTTVYSPYDKSVGAAANSHLSGNISYKEHYSSSGTWFVGVNGFTSTYNSTTYSPSYRETGEKTFSPFFNNITAPNNNNSKNWFTSDSNGTWRLENPDNSYSSSGKTRKQTSPFAQLYVDSSRFNNLNQIPNFKYGFIIFDADGCSYGFWNVYDWSSKGISSTGSGEGSYHGGGASQTGDTLLGGMAPPSSFKKPDYDHSCGIKITGNIWNKPLSLDENYTNVYSVRGMFYGTRETSTVKISGDGYNTDGCVCSITQANVIVYGNNKSSLRSTVMGAVKHDKESCANWDTYISQLKSASSGLGDPTSTTTSASVNYTLKSTSTYTYDQTTITFDPNGGTLSFSPATVTMNAPEAGTFSYDVSGKSATCSGFTFKGWSINKYDTTGSDEDVTVGKNTTLYAIWEKTAAEPTFGVTVNNNGGFDRWSGINNVTGSNGNIALFAPFKPGYKFLGWTGSNGNTAQKDVSIPKGASGSLSYTANWEEEKYENTVGSIRNGDIDKGIYDSVSFSTTPTATYGQFSGTSNVVYRPTNMAQGANIDTITGVNLNYALDGVNYTVENRTVKYYPQTNVLYEIGNTSNDATGILSNGSGLESGHVWTNVTSTAANVNALDSSIYGYAQAYAGDSGYSNGSAMKVTVSETDLNNVTAGTASWPTYRFKMKGTGFDINAHCGTDSGLLTVCVYTDEDYETMATYEAVNPNTGKTVTQNYSKAINTYFDDGVLYQTPVVHFENMPYGTYYVECKVAYNKLFDKTYRVSQTGGDYDDGVVFFEENGVTYADLSSFLGEDYSKVEMLDDLCEAPEAPDGTMLMDLEPASVGAGEDDHSYEVTIDSVRIYNPAGVNLSSGDIYDRYTADSELNPTYSNLRAGLLTKATDASGIPGLTGTLYIEKEAGGSDAETNMTSAYKRNGSVNEIYLTTGSVIGLDVPATGNVHIALRSPKGGTVVAQVGSKTFTINTATELYYDVTDALTVSGGTRTLTVTLQSGDLLAIGELKTFGSAPSNAPARLSAKSLSAARIALNVAEEHPLNVPEEITFTVDFGDAGSAEITLPKTRLSFDLDEETGKWIASAKLTAEEVAALFEENADTDHYTLDNAGEITVKATQEENGWEAAEQKVITNEIAPETEDITFTIDLGKDYGVVNVVIPADELKCEKVNGVWTASANVTVEQLADLIAKAGLSDKIKADEAITVSAENVDGVWVVEIAKAPVSETPVDPGTDEPGTDEPGTDDPTEDEPWYSWIIKLIQKIIEFFKTIFQRIKLAISGIMN